MGRTGISVSRLCFGALTLSQLQAALPIEKGAALIRLAMHQGVNCLDTAEYYQNYETICAAETEPEQLRLITKCYAYDRQGAEESLNKALAQSGRMMIDVMMLHEQESEWTLRGHSEALDFFVEQKEKGTIKAVGVSTHYVACAKACADHPKVDVIEAICNPAGLGIPDGTQDEMNAALARAHLNGKGIIAMKPLGGGHFSTNATASLEYAMSLEFIDSIALGMQTEAEVRLNAAIFNGLPCEPFMESVHRQPRRLHIADWCIGCGACVHRCANKALSIVNGRACVNTDACALCGYCAGACKEFCIKVF